MLANYLKAVSHDERLSTTKDFELTTLFFARRAHGGSQGL